MESMEPEMEEYLDLLGDETKFGILFALKMFGSLNLKHIAKCLGKSEPAILRQMKLLTKMNLITLDQQESENSWGKFYQLTPKGLEIFSKTKQISDEVSENSLTISWYKKMALAIKSLSSFNHNIAQFASSVIVEDAPQLIEQERKKEGNYGDVMVFAMSNVLLKTKAEVKEYLSIIEEFRKKLLKFKAIEADREKPNQILYLSSIPIQKIHPLKKKRESDDIYKK
jgi:DNA-binding transcriptional ArsR family regulator